MGALGMSSAKHSVGLLFSACIEKVACAKPLGCSDFRDGVGAVVELELQGPAHNRVHVIKTCDVGKLHNFLVGKEALKLLKHAGPKETRAWTVAQGARAPQAAGVIHTDFEHGFIRAETIAYADYVAHKGEAGARDAGKFRLEGKDYVVADGDVMHFRFNA